MRKAIWLTAMFAVPVSAQEAWTPVVAKLRVVETRIEADGREVELRRAEGVFLRDSAGRQLSTEAPVRDGETASPRSATLIDYSAGESFQLLYHRKQDLRRRVPPARPTPLTDELLKRAEEKSLGAEFVNGVFCRAFPVEGGGAQSDLQVTGRGWRSVEHDLDVKNVMEFKSGGVVSRVVTEKYDIRLGVEPDPKRLEIPGGFEVVDFPSSIGVKPIG